MPATAEPESANDAEIAELTDETRRANERSNTAARRLSDLEYDVHQLKSQQSDLTRGIGDLTEAVKLSHTDTTKLLRQLLTRLPEPPPTPPDTLHRATLLGATIAGAIAGWKAILALFKGD
jgi:chromosome segregation ATPase